MVLKAFIKFHLTRFLAIIQFITLFYLKHFNRLLSDSSKLNVAHEIFFCAFSDEILIREITETMIAGKKKVCFILCMQLIALLVNKSRCHAFTLKQQSIQKI